MRTLRRLATRRRRTPDRRRLLLLGLLLLTVAAFLAGRSSAPAPAPSAPFTVAGSWGPMRLLASIEAGRVASIGAEGGGGAIDLLDPWDGTELRISALTTEGQRVPIDTETTAAAILRAVRDLGHGALLSSEARAALVADENNVAYGPRPFGLPLSLWSSWINLVLLGISLGIGWWLVARTPIGGRLRPRLLDRSDGAPDDGGRPVGWNQVAGCEEAKAELAEVVEFLRDGDRFGRVGATVPRGVLLFGPPGTGKTLLARAVAAEAGVPFFPVSGSEFVEMYVGVGARRVRDLFARARKTGGGVVFIDELDAIGGTRGARLGSEERDQTLNQILIELDGMERNTGIVVIGATNRIESLDAALLRPGRLGRRIHVGHPDVRGRRAILAVHAEGKPIESERLLDDLARRTGRMTGAQLADLLNEAAILAARRERPAIGPRELTDALLKVQVGTSRQRSMDDRERSVIAAHEAGHAVAGRMAGSPRQLEEISLFAHGEALGVTVWSGEETDLPDERILRATLVGILGGRAAEDLLLRTRTPGASHDYQQATTIARMMVTRWGFGRDPLDGSAGPSGRGTLGFLSADGEGAMPDGLEEPATRAMAALLDEAYLEARRLLLVHLGTLWRVGEELVREERMGGERFNAIVAEGAEAPDERTADWRSADADPRPWPEILAAHRGAAAGPAAAVGGPAAA